MTRFFASAIALLLTVVLIIAVQTAPPKENTPKENTVAKAGMAFDRGRNTEDDSDPAPDSVMSVFDGITYYTGTTIGNAPEGYFESALFIGDSRMEGLRLYGNLKEATFFCTTSMGVMNYNSKNVKVDGYGSIKLDSLLTKKTFKTIYLCMGINEIGYDLDALTQKYVDFIDLLREKCPNARIIIMPNMHVTKKRSDTDKHGVTNSRIDTLNAAFAAMHNGENIFYMETNQLFDVDGALNPQYTGDNTHLYAKYYELWENYIRSHAIYDTPEKSAGSET